MSQLQRSLRFSLTFSKLVFHRRLQHTKPKLSISGDVIPVFSNANQFPDKVALRDDKGRYSYADIFANAKELATNITQKLGGKTGERIMFLCPNNVDYIVTLWGIWMSGQIG